MKNAIKLGLILMIICALAGGGLAAVYAMTKPVIERREKEDLLNAAKAAIPGAEFVEEVTDEKGNTFWIGKSGEEVVGAAMHVSASGFGQSPIQIMVGIDKEGKIASLTVLSLSETPGIGSRVKDPAFLQRFIGKKDTSSVDVISGATVSSSAVKAGVTQALEILTPKVAPSEEGPIDLASIPDGTYKGTGNGLFGPIEVSVTVAGGKITKIEVTSHSDTPDIASQAVKGVPKSMIEGQKVDVDVVSGATFTSKGIIQAVKDALSKATK